MVIHISSIDELDEISTTVSFTAFNDECEINGTYVISADEDVDSMSIKTLRNRAINNIRAMIDTYDR